MANMVKNVARKSRDSIINPVLGAIANLKQEIQDARREVKQTQLEINHFQLLIKQETLSRVKNSGTIYLSEHEILTKIFSGLKMYLDPRDLAITPHLALDGVWEHRITAAWLAVVKPTDTVLDIGSNNG